MVVLREKDVGLKSVNGGRFASPKHGEGAELISHRALKVAALRYDLSRSDVESMLARRLAGDTILEISESFGLSAPAAQDVLVSASGGRQITADDQVEPELLQALEAMAVNECHVERKKRGKTLLVLGGVKIPVAFNSQGVLEFHVGSEVIEAGGDDDHYAWVAALHQAVNAEAVKRNISPLIIHGDVDLDVNPYDGSGKGAWKHEGHEVKFCISADSAVAFDDRMSAQDGVALQRALGVKSLEDVAPCIALLRMRISRAHRWALWNPAMDVHRHAARPGLRDGFEYARMQAAVSEKLAQFNGEIVESRDGMSLTVQGRGYVAEVLVGARGEPAYFVDGTQVFGLDETKVKLRALSQFLAAHLDDVQKLERARLNGLHLRQLEG